MFENNQPTKLLNVLQRLGLSILTPGVMDTLEEFDIPINLSTILSIKQHNLLIRIFNGSTDMLIPEDNAEEDSDIDDCNEESQVENDYEEKHEGFYTFKERKSNIDDDTRIKILMGQVCPYCLKNTVRSEPLLLEDYKFSGKQYCKNCNDVSVSLDEETGKPLGSVADIELRRKRNVFHKIFDTLWLDGIFSSRDSAYQFLAHKMGIPYRFTHIAMFDDEQCVKAGNIVVEKIKEVDKKRYFYLDDMMDELKWGDKHRCEQNGSADFKSFMSSAKSSYSTNFYTHMQDVKNYPLIQ